MVEARSVGRREGTFVSVRGWRARLAQPRRVTDGLPRAVRELGGGSRERRLDESNRLPDEQLGANPPVAVGRAPHTHTRLRAASK